MPKLRCLAIGALFASFGSGAPAQEFPPTTPEYLTIEENRLLLDGLPGPAVLTPVTMDQANTFFQSVRDEGVEYRYVIGSCEDRAHFVTMMARKAGLPVAKVWAIAPKRYTLLSRELLSVKDPAGIKDRVLWGHHVAPVLLVRDVSGAVKPMVLDRSFSPDRLMPLSEWTASLGTPRAKFFFTSANDYLFRSLDGFTTFDNRNLPGKSPEPPVSLPSWFPDLLTGDFQPYNSGWDNIIATGMSQNDLAMRVVAGGFSGSKAELQVLRRAISDEDSMDALVTPTSVPGLGAATRNAVRQFFQIRLDHWKARLVALQ